MLKISQNPMAISQNLSNKGLNSNRLHEESFNVFNTIEAKPCHETTDMLYSMMEIKGQEVIEKEKNRGKPFLPFGLKRLCIQTQQNLVLLETKQKEPCQKENVILSIKIKLTMNAFLYASTDNQTFDSLAPLSLPSTQRETCSPLPFILLLPSNQTVYPKNIPN